MPQLQLPIFPYGATEINRNLAIMREKDQVTYIYGHLPIFTHHVKDMNTFRMIISQIYVNGNAKQSEICQAFGITPISVKRSVKLHREKGAIGFYEERNYRGAAVLTPEALKKAQELLDAGLESSQASKELGIKTDTFRKAVKAGRLHKAVKKTVHPGKSAQRANEA